MGLTKNYLRFVHESTFGLVAASQVGSSIKFLPMRNTKDRYVAAPANENIYIWDTKTKQIINRLNYDGDNATEITLFDCYHGGHPRTNLIAVGYVNGHVKVFEYETGLLKATFTGHRTSISALAFDKDGSRLASGSKDCTIVLWDMVEEKGLYSLKGHKSSITQLAFLFNSEHQKDMLISSASDTVSTLKFWDLQLQHCFCTIPGQSSGILSFALLHDRTKLVAGLTGPELKVYSIEFLEKSENEDLEPPTISDEGIDNELENSENEYGLRVKHLGNILRTSSSKSNRVQGIVIDEDETMMICYANEKHVELYPLRNFDEALTYAKKRAKKEARRQAKRKRRQEEAGQQPDDDEAEEEARSNLKSLDDLEPQQVVDCIFNRKINAQKLSNKVKALDVFKIVRKDGLKVYHATIMSSTNRIDNYMINVKSPVGVFKSIGSVETLSHRSDVKALAVSSDNTLIMSSSSESTKIWRMDTNSCTTTIDTDYATCCVFAEAQNLSANYTNRFGLIGTKQGAIQIVDIFSANVIETIQVCCDNKPLNSICILPDKSGIFCGGEDGISRIYNYIWNTSENEGQKQTNLSLAEDRSLSFRDGITCVNVSANGKLLAVALLDSTVRVHFVDTLKYFLTMYGHKFPVTTMDISDDSTLIVTGSPDKNIKIWGLDFGDCHKSIFAHDDVITCVKFVPKTHHVFSCSRDNTIKQWDCDHFLKIQTLKRHMAEIWCMGISQNGRYLITGSHDKSIRLYRKTEEIIIPREEEENEREFEDERNVFERQENIVLGETNLETGFAPKMTIETVKTTDRLIEAIEVFGAEQEKEKEYNLLCQQAESRGDPRPSKPEKDPLLNTAFTDDYNRFMLETLRKIKSSELEEILLTLPFDYVRKLLTILVILLEKRWDVELMVRCATFLLKVNFGQIAASPPLVPVLCKLKEIILKRSTYFKDCAGFNLMALEHLGQNREYQSTKLEELTKNSSMYY